jgi:protein-glutamine gamma-glutamyltransferase
VRFAFAHKLTTYLMVMCAFAAIAMSGYLAPPWVLGGLLGTLVSWFWEPPRVRLERWNIFWTALSMLVFLFQVLSVFVGRDLILAGGELLVYFGIVKLFNRASSRDYQQLYALSFLMLVAGTVLNSEITYGFFFLGYVVCATWALILFHLRREMEDNFLLKHSADRPSERVEVARVLQSRRIVGGKFFLGTSMVSLIIFLGSTVLFLAIPRIGFGIFVQKSRSGVHLAGFADGVELGGHGVIKRDDTVVMRITVEDEWEGDRAASIHWRGAAFDRYRDGVWSRTPMTDWPREAKADPVTILVATDDPPGSGDKLMRHIALETERAQGARLRRKALAGMRHTVYLEPLGNDFLFGASMPLAFEVPPSLEKKRPPWKGSNDELRFSHKAGIAYVVYSQMESPPASDLRRAPASFLPPGYRDVYLQLPDRLRGGKLAALAGEITAGEGTNYDRARAIERWLKTNLSYTLDMKAPPEGTDPVEFFLFDRRAGHCEYFSSAMVLMLRALDIPARNVNGFLGGEWNEYEDYVAVRAGDAHSWVEVYFPGSGWVTFDPTPPSDELGRGTGWTDKLRRWFDTMRFKWFKWVIEYDIYQQLSIFDGIGDLFQGAGSGVGDAWGATKGWVREHRAEAFGGAAGLVALVTLLYLRKRRREHTGTAAGRRQRKRAPIAQVYQSTLDLLRKRGLARPESASAARARRGAGRARRAGRRAAGRADRAVLPGRVRRRRRRRRPGPGPRAARPGRDRPRRGPPQEGRLSRAVADLATASGRARQAGTGIAPVRGAW